MANVLARIFRRNRNQDDHSEFRDLSSEYIEGELDQETSERVDAHLEMCPPCSAFFRTLRATIELLSSSERREAPASFRERLRQKLSEERSA